MLGCGGHPAHCDEVFTTSNPGPVRLSAGLHMTVRGEGAHVSHKTLVRIAGVVGGLCWLGQAAVNKYDAAEPAVNALYWGGGALILVALVGLGMGLVSGARWLRVIVGLAVLLLVWSILEILHAETSDNIVDGGFWLSLALICSAALLGGATRDDEAASRGGSHAK